MSVETDLNVVTEYFPTELVKIIVSKIDYSILKEINITTRNDVIRQISDEIFQKIDIYKEIIINDPSKSNLNKLIRDLEGMIKEVLDGVNLDTLKYINYISKNDTLTRDTNYLIEKMISDRQLYRQISYSRPNVLNLDELLLNLPFKLIEMYLINMADMDESTRIDADDDDFPPTHYVEDVINRVRDPYLISIISPLIAEHEIIYSPIDGYDFISVINLSDSYSQPTVEFLESQYQFLIRMRASHQKALLQIVSNICKYNGFIKGSDINQACFEFLDKKNFNYNSKGQFDNSVQNLYMIQYACTTGNFQLLLNLYNRGASLYNDPYLIFNSLIESTIVCSNGRDVSEIITFLTQHGILITPASYQICMSDYDNLEIHQNTKNLLKKMKLIK
jgi:hypothetical protein